MCVIAEVVAALGLSPIHVLIVRKLAECDPHDYISIHSLKVTLCLEALEFDRILFDFAHLQIITFTADRNFISLSTYTLPALCQRVARGLRLVVDPPLTLCALLEAVTPTSLHAPAMEFAPRSSTAPLLPPPPRPLSKSRRRRPGAQSGSTGSAQTRRSKTTAASRM